VKTRLDGVWTRKIENADRANGQDEDNLGAREVKRVHLQARYE
jgi:hypothetical protein